MAKTRILDFQSFGENLWRIADVFRDDTLKTTEYLEEFSYFFFLKLWDERERAEEQALKELGRGPYVPYLPEECRFYAWAEDPDQFAKKKEFESLVAFIQDLFSRLSKMGDVVEVKDPNTRLNRTCKHLEGPFWRLPSEKPGIADGAVDPNLVKLPPTRNLELFRKLFRNHSLRVRYDPTIRELCRRLLDIQIQEQTEGKWDKLGRAYEFVVNKLGEQKQYGQYFTPRHIIDRMVQVIDPEPGELIYDPAAGTCGFLVRAFEYVQGKISRRISDYAKRERAIRELKEKHLFGVEKAPDVFKLGLMNMILHGDGSTHMDEKDSLSSQAQETNRNRYDVILANPPFGPTAQERTAQFEHHIRLYEALFTQHFINSLKPGGRAAFVIKEGLLFDSKRVLRAICRKMVDQTQVLAVLSLPNGVFNPYSGAKTSIVVLRKPRTKEEARTDRVWFYQVTSDGRDLGATRRPLTDLPTDGDLADMASRFPYQFTKGIPTLKPNAEQESASARSWWATVAEIRKNDYTLTAGRYSPHRAETVEHEAPQVLINRLLDLEDEIRDDLQDLMALISVPDSAAGLEGAFAFRKTETVEDDPE